MTISQIIPPFPLKRHFIVCSRGEKEKNYNIWRKTNCSAFPFLHFRVKICFHNSSRVFCGLWLFTSSPAELNFREMACQAQQNKKMHGKIVYSVQSSVFKNSFALDSSYSQIFKTFCEEYTFTICQNWHIKSTLLEKESFSCFLTAVDLFPMWVQSDKLGWHNCDWQRDQMSLWQMRHKH